jgi:tetratricopeptide (TPR) repeat protein
LAEGLLATALRGVTEEERLPTTLAGVEFLWLTDQLRQADRLLEALLGEPKFARLASLWRLRATLAVQRRLPALHCACLERALEITWQHRWPGGLELEAVRKDFGLLLAGYQQTIEAHTTLQVPPPRDLAERVVRAADRWRSLDPEDPVVCPLAAQLLQRLGMKELAWEYLNTPLAIFPPDAAAWSELGKALVKLEDFELAALAYEQASAADPADAQLLWDQAQVLERAGKHADARAIYRRLAAGSWAPPLRWIQAAARRQLPTPPN